MAALHAGSNGDAERLGTGEFWREEEDESDGNGSVNPRLYRLLPYIGSGESGTLAGNHAAWQQVSSYPPLWR
jgi:hypothetical protein